jgi:hypothetical protein
VEVYEEDMTSTQEKLEDRLDKLYNLPDDVPKELLQGIGFLRQFVNEERHGENKGLLKSSEIWHFLKEPVQALIDSAKREGAIEELKKLPSNRHDI